MIFLFGYFLLLFVFLMDVDAHGRLFQPPGRSTAWRYDFNTPHNYNDHEIYCGGYARQWSRNKGKCGPCGDPYDTPQPRANENGGKFGLGVIVGEYEEGQTIEIGVELTANHRGFFEFRICPLNAPGLLPETDECFQDYLLKNPQGGERYYVGQGSRRFFAEYKLPKGLTCTQCVLQWRYVAGNNWGKCSNGTGMVGCGPQEEFRSCSDIRIVTEDGSADDTTRFTPAAGVDGTSTAATVTIIPEVPEHSYGGHVTAITVAIILVVLFVLILIIHYFWYEGRIYAFVRRRKQDWTSKIPEGILHTNIFGFFRRSSGKKQSVTTPFSEVVQITPDGAPPPIPPRRNRRNSDRSENGITITSRNSLAISSPVSVSINGVQVQSSMETNPNLNVPNTSS